jgi:NAD dependent epimerase/dehydratase family enzyme
MSIGVSGAQTMSWILFPDVVDIAQLGLGERIAGSLSGAMTFTRKAAAAFAIFFVGNVLNLSGFIPKTDLVPHPVQPQSAILGIGRIADKPVIKDNAVVPGKVMPISMSVDHRIVDGGEVARFLNEVLSMLKEPLLIWANEGGEA